MFEEQIAAVNAKTEQNQSDTQEEKRVYTVDEIMDILSISKSTAYHLVYSGVFHSVKVGNQHRISKKSFDEWLDQKKEKKNLVKYGKDEISSYRF